MKATKNITLDLLETGSPVIIKAKQNDRNTRYIAAHLYVDGLSYPVPSGTEIAFRYKKPDGTAGFYDALPNNSPAITVSGNTVTVELVEQVLTVAGCVHCEINMYNAASEKLTTFTFEIAVEESVLADAEIISSDYYNVLTAEIAKAMQAVTDATEQAENAAQSAQDAADSAAMSKDWAAGQPVTYSGTPVSIAYAGAQRIASITAYGENAQGGTTEAPVALTGVDSVHVCGRNLLPLPYSQVSETKNGLNIAVNADGTITVSGTATAETYLNLKPIPASLYRLMGVTGIVPAYDYPVTKNGFTFFDLTIQPHVEFASVYIVIAKGSIVNRTYRPYIIKSAEPLPYEPYQGSVTTLPIPRPLRRVGDVQDVCVTRQDYESAEKLVVTYNVGYIESYADESITTAWISSTGALSTGAEVAYVLSSPETYATDPLDIDNAAGPLTVMTGGELEVRMTELVGMRSDVSNNTVAFTETAQDADIASGEKLSVLFGKIKKRFSVVNKLVNGAVYPNLGTNTNFPDAINQRGKTTYTGDNTSPYCIDRWRISNGTTYTVGTFTLSAATYANRACGMWQSNEMGAHQLSIGDDITVSIYANGKLHTPTMKVIDRDLYDAFANVPASYDCDDFEIVLCTYARDNTMYNLGIYPKKPLTVNYIKWEKGSAATPYVPKSYRAELAECQRYFYRIYNSTWQTGSLISGWGFIVPFDTPVPMRSNPTINFVDAGLKVFEPSGWVNATSAETYGFNKNCARVNVKLIITLPSDIEGRSMLVTGIESFSADF